MKILGEGRFVRLLERDSYEYVERLGCTGIISVVALTAENEMIFVEQFRHPVAARTIELVAGLVGDMGAESLETAARRELLEESGYEAGDLQFLMECPSSGGITAARVNYFLARDVVKIHAGGGVDDEDITVHTVPTRDVHGWLQEKNRAGLLLDPKVYLGLSVALHGWNGTSDP
jgi:ADP-ribose pyrophosphatase